MAATTELRMPLVEFLQWDDGTDMRYELIDGTVRAMGLSTIAHGVILANLTCEIGGNLRPGHRGLIRIGVLVPGRPDTFYVPDLTITAAPMDDPNRQHVVDPRLIVEVVDPDTVDHDRGRKLYDYWAIPSVREVMLVSATEWRAEVFRRQSRSRWLVDTSAGDEWLRLETCDEMILTTGIYAGVDLAA
jgi:Uma2 family endonuclease